MKVAIYIILGSLALMTVAILIFLQQPKFGKLPGANELKAISASENYRSGEFKNIEETPLFTSGQSFASVLWENLSNPGQRLQPAFDLPVSPVDFSALDPEEDLVIWLGHSSYYIQIAGRRILLDPVFSEDASPMPGVNRAFAGTSYFSAADFPPIDLLMISHDHWDHLDYPSAQQLKDKVSEVVVGLGMGAIFRGWGYRTEQVTEVDWGDSVALSESLTLYATPSRHYSGRGLKRNQTLWLGFVLESTERRLFFSGDSGYGKHFFELGQRFDGFDLVALDQGQYDSRWAYIHMTPEEAALAAEELGARVLLPAHVGRFSLARHAWDEPFQRMSDASQGKHYELLTPMIGEPVLFDNANSQSFTSWWQANSNSIQELP